MSFEFNGKKYREASAHQKEWGRKIISEFKFEGHERILDLGCGDGVLTAQLAQYVPQGSVIGIDASHSMIEEARKHKCINLTFKPMDIHDMDFTCKFDFIFSNAALHWIKDHQRLLENVYSILNQGGIIRFSFAAEGNCPSLLKVIKEVMAMSEFAQSFNGFEWPWYMPSVKAYHSLLKKIPFRNSKAWAENADKYFPNSKTLIAWIDQPSIIPFLEYIDNKKKQPFRDMVVEKMLKETSQKDGTYFETFRRMNIFARK